MFWNMQLIKESAQPDVRHEISRLVKPMTQVCKHSSHYHVLLTKSIIWIPIPRSRCMLHELFSHRNGHKLTKPMVCCLQALDAAFNHDLEQQQKSSKTGNRHNGFWAKETGLTNTWSETDGQCARMYKSCCRILEASTILIFFPPSRINSCRRSRSMLFAAPESWSMSSIVCNWMNSETRSRMLPTSCTWRSWLFEIESKQYHYDFRCSFVAVGRNYIRIFCSISKPPLRITVSVASVSCHPLVL